MNLVLLKDGQMRPAPEGYEPTKKDVVLVLFDICEETDDFVELLGFIRKLVESKAKFTVWYTARPIPVQIW